MPTIALSPCRQMSDYLESVRRAGATPLELTLADEPAAIAARVDGLMLTGGGDVEPALYGAVAHGTYSAAEPGRDAFEIALVRAVLDAGKPVFAICRGMQLLNVALGGDLVQDIPTEVNGAAHHDVREPRYALAHEVWTTQGSRFSTLMREKLVDGESCQVNSRHHQAVKHLGAAPCLCAPGGAVARPRIHAERTGGEWPGGAVGVNGEGVMILVWCSEGEIAIIA